jgi:CheY-like chemotaxis protein
VQILTSDVDRQHGFARGAYSFLTKPSSTQDLEQALVKIRNYLDRPRKRLLVVEDNSAEQLSIRELLHHDDIEIRTVGTGAECLGELRTESADCVVLDLRLPDMSGFDVLSEIGADPRVVGDPGCGVYRPRTVGRRRCTVARPGAQRRCQRRGIARATARRNVAFLHRVVEKLPPQKQHMLERLRDSDEKLVGRTVLLVDDDARNVFALSSVLERRGMRVLAATTGNEAIQLIETNPETSRSFSWTS